jgi:hypothetical protein
MDIWQRLQQAPDDLEGCTAALQHLFGAGQLYASLAATTRQQPNLLREALPKFKEYLGYYAKSVDPYCGFPCHCPLCRGAAGRPLSPRVEPCRSVCDGVALQHRAKPACRGLIRKPQHRFP